LAAWMTLAFIALHSKPVRTGPPAAT
jgi:hypothetical protein